MKKGNKRKTYFISDWLKELPKVGSVYKGGNVIKVKKRLKLHEVEYDGYYKIITIGKAKKKKHYFIMVLPNHIKSFVMGTMGSGKAFPAVNSLNEPVQKKY